jgi:hypothetical protein
MTLNEAIRAAKRECRDPYARTYLDAIPQAIEEGARQATAQEGLRVQILYALSNMGTWRGETAREAKKAFRAYCKA